MKRGCTSFVLLLCSIYCAVNIAGAQNSADNDQERSVAERAVSSGEGGDQRDRGYALRRVDLEQELIELQYSNKYSEAADRAPKPVRCIEVYEVTRGGIRVERGLIVSAAVDLDDAPTWLVAYDRTTKEAFHLFGFNDSDSGFNAVIKDLNLKPIDDEFGALTLFSTFTKLACPDFGNQVVRNEMDLMSAALADFRKRKSANPKTFQTYWDACPGSVKKLISRPSVSASSKGFSITFFSCAEGRITRNVAHFSAGGQISQVESKTVFEWPQ